MLLRLFERIFVSLLPGSSVGGVRVVVSDADMPRDFARKAIAAAMEELAMHDPRRFRQVTRRLKYVHVWGGHYTASTLNGGMSLSAQQLADSDAGDLAGILVHEMVHVRIRSARVRHTDEQLPRVERRCLLEHFDTLYLLGRADLRAEDCIQGVLEHGGWTREDAVRDLECLAQTEGLPSISARFLRWRARRIRESGFGRTNSAAERPDSGQGSA